MACSDSTSGLAASSQLRLPHLRVDCLRRNGNRCVVSEMFNQAETTNCGPRFLDNNGILLANNPHDFDELEVVHIIPHTLRWKDNADTQSVSSQCHVIALLPRHLLLLTVSLSKN